MEKDLFGNKIRKKKTRLEIALNKYDKDTFNDRFVRLKYLNKIFPKGYSFVSDLETAYIFDETKMAFINGEFIATLMLSQAYIERKLQSCFSSKGLEKEAKRGLKFMIDYAKENEVINDFLLNKINILRKKRNPFSHLKPYEYKFNISQRIFTGQKGTKEVLENDAKEAISLMYLISITKL